MTSPSKNKIDWHCPMSKLITYQLNCRYFFNSFYLNLTVEFLRTFPSDKHNSLKTLLSTLRILIIWNSIKQNGKISIINSKLWTFINKNRNYKNILHELTNFYDCSTLKMYRIRLLKFKTRQHLRSLTTKGSVHYSRIHYFIIILRLTVKERE